MNSKQIKNPLNDPQVIGNLVSYILGCPPTWARETAELMIKDDFPLNNIKTMSDVIGYLQYARDFVLKGKKMLSWKEITQYEKESKIAN